MKNPGLKILFALSALLYGGTVSAQINVEKTALALSAEEAASDWQSEAYPIGNGYMGAMIFGGVTSDLIQVNEHTVWSGGPGQRATYDGGHRRTPAQNHKTLQDLRRSLQDKMTAFSAKDFAYINNAGQIITKNYAAETSTERAYISDLIGDKSTFGSYQTLGNILVSDPATMEATVILVESNARNTVNSGEDVENLFDGSITTKWFADQNPAITLPRYVAWEYDREKIANSYSFVSGNDMQPRDPTSWKLYGSNTSMSEDLVLLDTRSNEVFNNRREERIFTLENPAPYKYYRLEITATYGNNPPQMSEIMLNSDAVAAKHKDYKRTLDIDNAIATVSYNEDGINFAREYFMSYPKNVMAMHLTASETGKLNRVISITTPQTNNVKITAEGDVITMTGNPSGGYAHTADDRLIYAKQVKVIPIGGSMSITNGNRILVEDADEIIVLMSAATNYVQSMNDNFNYFSTQNTQEIIDKVAAKIDAASGISYEDLKAEHLQDYKNLYDRLAFSIEGITVPDKTTRQLLLGMKNNSNSANENRYLEMLYYQFGRYLLISSSRPGSLPANLQGVWAEGIQNPWDADYHTNINLQMNYWLAQQTNLSECHIPMIEYANSLVPRGKKTAQHYYCKENGDPIRNSAWVIHHENNIWGNTAPGTWYEGFYFPAAAAWICQDIWEYYQFNSDKDFLEENYQTMLGAALFWVDNLWTDERDGSLVANPSYSPEHGPYSLGTSCDQAIIWELFDFVIKASDILGKTSAEIDEIKAAKSRLAGPQVGLHGQLLEWKDEITMDTPSGDTGHRHTNHLHWAHPGSQIVADKSVQDSLYHEAMKYSLSVIRNSDKSTGWSMGWKVNFWARLRDGNRTHNILKYALNHVDINNPADKGNDGGGVFSNLFDVHPDYTFQIDGNFGVTAGMTEMLVQSQGNCVEILPALPDAWSTGSFKGIKARGNFEINAQWNGGDLQNAEIISNSGNVCVLKYPNIVDYDIPAGANIIDNNTISFNTEIGQIYEIKK